MSWDNIYGASPKHLETDDEFRARLLYVTDGPRTVEMILRAAGRQLDVIAEEYGLKRNYVTS